MKFDQIKKKVKSLPTAPGVYFFRDGRGKILYIGKATSLKDRVGSYFIGVHENRIESMIGQIADLDFEQTDSVLEALILEANMIKKFKPKYNVREKDDKSFSYFIVTKEEFPRVLIARETDLDNEKKIYTKLKVGYSKIYGPYVSKRSMQTALDILRKIFPFHARNEKSEKGCLDYQIGKCPGPYDGAIIKQDYKKNIRGIRYILEGKKKRLIQTLNREMNEASKAQKFEDAGLKRNQIFALEHIRDTALLVKEDAFNELEERFLGSKRKNKKELRIEAYDISNIGGKDAVGSMVVFKGEEPDKKEYRKFKIRTVGGANDIAMMREVLFRRFNNDWLMPDLIMLDGGKGHLNMAKEVLKFMGINVNVIAVAKGPTRKKVDIYGKSDIVNRYILALFKDARWLEKIREEAHRFAIGYHRKLSRSKLTKDE